MKSIKIFLFIIFAMLLIIGYNVMTLKSELKTFKNTVEFSSELPQVQLYYSIMKYSKLYNIPSGYLFAIAYHETGYRGPADAEYIPNQTSPANAVGPMQVMLTTAKMFDKNITYDKLKNDIDSNVKISAKLLQHLYKINGGNWELAFGAYNTGKFVTNDYARQVKNKKFDWK